MKFSQKHPIIFNLLLMALCAVVLVVLAMWGLNIWTAHGKVQIVPDVRSMSVAQAQSALRGCNLLAEVVDSVYGNDVARGSVVEQVPPPGNKVKPGRTVYLTINAYEPKKVMIPDLVGSSLRQARATLQSLGFTDIREVRVPSDYKDLVLAIKSMGVPLRAGTSLAASSTIVVEVGEGYDPYASLNDSIEAYSETEWQDYD